MCYDLIRPDHVQLLSWRAGWNDFTMPYLVQATRHQADQVKNLEAQVKALSVKAASQSKAEEDQPILAGMKMIGGSGG